MRAHRANAFDEHVYEMELYFYLDDVVKENPEIVFNGFNAR